MNEDVKSSPLGPKLVEKVIFLVYLLQKIERNFFLSYSTVKLCKKGINHKINNLTQNKIVYRYRYMVNVYV